MATDDNILRTKILMEINEDFHFGDRINFAITFDNPNLLNELIRCFDEEDDIIRELASRAIIKVASTEQGRAILVDFEQVPKIRELFDDGVV